MGAEDPLADQERRAQVAGTVRGGPGRNKTQHRLTALSAPLLRYVPSSLGGAPGQKLFLRQGEIGWVEASQAPPTSKAEEPEVLARAQAEGAQGMSLSSPSGTLPRGLLTLCSSSRGQARGGWGPIPCLEQNCL